MQVNSMIMRTSPETLARIFIDSMTRHGGLIHRRPRRADSKQTSA
jgi:hypothetical protein